MHKFHMNLIMSENHGALNCVEGVLVGKICISKDKETTLLVFKFRE